MPPKPGKKKINEKEIIQRYRNLQNPKGRDKEGKE